MPQEISDSIQQLSERIGAELDRLGTDRSNERRASDSLVYIGNWQDAIPRSIWVDPTLEAIDVRSWGIIRIQAQHGSAVVVSLNKLLAGHLGYSNATVSRVLYVLRLTRWISLCSTLRTEQGQFRGNIYAIHDAPVALHDAIYLDGDYLRFVKTQTGHNNGRIKIVARSVWRSITEMLEEDSTVFHNTQPSSSISDFIGQVSYSSQVQKLNPVDSTHVQFLNAGKNSQVQNLNVDSPTNRIEENQSLTNQVQNLNVDTICSSCSSKETNLLKKKDNKKTTTTNPAGIVTAPEQNLAPELIYPEGFNRNEIFLAKRYLQKVEVSLQQNFLDELAGVIKAKRHTAKPIRNPIGYLSWLCQQHSNGETHLTSMSVDCRKQREQDAITQAQLKRKQHELTRLAHLPVTENRKSNQAQSSKLTDKISRIQAMLSKAKGGANSTSGTGS